MKQSSKALSWCLATLVGTVGLLLASWVVISGFELGAKVAALRAAGQPVSLAELAHAPIPPADNAEAYLVRADSDIAAINTDIYTFLDSLPSADQEAFYDLRPTPAMRQKVRDALAAHPQTFGLVEQASNCPDEDPRLDFNSGTAAMNLLPTVQRWQSICRFAMARVLDELDAGRPEEALRTCLAMFRLTRLLDRNPTLISHLVCLAITGETVRATNLVLRSGPLSPSAAESLDHELAGFDMPEAFRHTLRTERAKTLEWFREMAAETSFNSSWLPGFKSSQCDYLDGMAELIDGAALPYADWRRVNAKATSGRAGNFTETSLSTMDLAHDAMLRVVAQLRALRVLNALLQREQAGDTGEPVLADLGLPADATTDPFNDLPLHIKKGPGGWLVYSVGQDLKDDGGDLFDDVGVGPPTAAKAEGSAEEGK